MVRPPLELSTAAVLAVAFGTAYLALGPGCFLSVDEANVLEMAYGVYQRGDLEVPAMNTARIGRGGAYYAHRGPAFSYFAVPFAAIGDMFDDRHGSIAGGVVAGPALGTPEHPLRWGGRFSIFTALAANALIGGLAVGALYLVCLKLGATPHAALLTASAGGAATLLASESTHFFQHPLETLMLLLGFWFLPARPALGSLSLGLAVLARPNAAPAAAVIWLYGAYRARRLSPGLIAPPFACAALYLFYNHLQFGNPLDFGYSEQYEQFHLTPGEALKAAAAYLISPGLSIFLFAPPLLLTIAFLRRHFAARPSETACLLLASAAHLVLIAFYSTWHGELSYGPRFMLAPMVLLTALAFPAFEERNLGAALAVATGVAVQVLGVLVYATANEWYRVSHGVGDGGAWVFTLSTSPPWVHLSELLQGRSIIPWAGRVLARPSSAPLALLIALVTTAGFAAWRLSTHAPDSRPSKLPELALLAISIPLILGITSTIPIDDSPAERIPKLLRAAVAAQSDGRLVDAEEYHAIILGLDPGHREARENLTRLQSGGQ